MTEQEFRERLKHAARNDGLSPERQMQVLARREGDERKVRNWHKAKYILVIALLLATGVTGAVATGLGGVDWEGKPVQYVEYAPIASTEAGARLQELFNIPDKAIVSVVTNLDPQEDEYAGLSSSTSNFFASSLAEMQVWVEAGGTLDWVKALPKGYALKLGRVGYACGKSGGMELISNEITDDGYMLTQFLIPEEHRFMSNYFMRLINEKEDEITVSVYMDSVKVADNKFRAGDDAEVELINVAGMDHALIITTQEKQQAALYQAFSGPQYYYRAEISRTGERVEWVNDYWGLTIEITTTDARLTPADLLAIFGLEAQ